MRLKNAILLTLLIILISGCTQDSDLNKNNNINEEINCDELEIKNLLESVNHCESDSDCTFESKYYCPFGCYQFYNKNADLTEIDKKVKIFRENKCNFCEYECMTPPRSEDIKCINNKCVDNRYHK